MYFINMLKIQQSRFPADRKEFNPQMLILNWYMLFNIFWYPTHNELERTLWTWALFLIPPCQLWILQSFSGLHKKLPEYSVVGALFHPLLFYDSLLFVWLSYDKPRHLNTMTMYWYSSVRYTSSAVTLCVNRNHSTYIHLGFHFIRSGLKQWTVLWPVI